MSSLGIRYKFGTLLLPDVCLSFSMFTQTISKVILCVTLLACMILDSEYLSRGDRRLMNVEGFSCVGAGGEKFGS
jgi:hypothetical protein